MLPQLLLSSSDQRPRTGNVQKAISFGGNERLGSPASLPLLRSNTKRRKGRFHSVGTIDVDEVFGDEDSSSFSPSIYRDDVSHMSSRTLKSSVLEKRKSAKVSALLNDLEKIGYDTIGGTGENMGSDGMKFLSNTSRVSTAESRSRLISGKQSSMSIAIEIETRYMEMKEKEKDSGPMPTRFKAAIVGDLLHRMESMYGDASRLLKPLTNELLTCVFADFAEASKKNQSPENYATFLASLHPYFEDCDNMRQELEDTKLELDAIHRGYKLKEIVKKFQTVRLAFQTTEVFLRDACFRLWKLLCLRRKQRERAARLRSLRHRWSRWVAFCSYKKKLDEEEFEQVMEEKMLKLAQFGKSSRKLKKQASELQRSTSNLSEGAVTDSNASPSRVDADLPIETDETARGGDHERAHVPFSVEIDVQVEEEEEEEEEGNQMDFEPSPKSVGKEREAKSGEGNRLSGRDFAASTEEDGDDEEKDDAAFHPIAIVRQSTFHHNQQNAPASWLNIHTVSTQTPPSWIEEYAEQRRVEQALALMKDKVVPLSQNGSFSASSDSAVPSPEKLFDCKMSISAARQLIAYVYERKFCDLQQNSNWVKSFEDYNLAQFSHLAMLARYHDLETSARLFQELMAVCQAYGHKNRRLLVFGRLCGWEMAQEEHHVAHNVVREGFYFRMLNVLVNRRLEMLINSFATELIPRDDVLSRLSEIYPHLDNSEQVMDRLISDIVDLPCSFVSRGPQSEHTVAMLNIDDVIYVLMGFYQLELRHNPQALLHRVGKW